MSWLIRALVSAWVGSVLLALVGCAGSIDGLIDEYLPEKEATYKSSKRLPPLEVPPDLSRAAINDALVVPGRNGGDGTTFSQYATAEQASANAATGGTAGVLPNFSTVKVEREGDKRWLVIQAPASKVWPNVRDFWLEQGFIIEVEDPGIGIMETDWAEKRSDLRSGFIERMMGRFSSTVYGAATRDKFRTRLERGSERGATEVYISHRGAEEISSRVGGTSITETYEEKAWQPRPSDPELEAEMLTRMMVYLGVAKEQALDQIAKGPARPDRARMVRESSGASVLSVDDEFSQVWRRTGLALDRVGFTVEDRDRSRGLYFVRYVDPGEDIGSKDTGFLSKLKFWESDEKPEATEYLISLVGGDQSTQILVLDKQGARDTTATADRILGLLHAQLR